MSVRTFTLCCALLLASVAFALPAQSAAQWRAQQLEASRQSEAIMREVWEAHLLNAWYKRRGDHLAFHLERAAMVPGSSALRARWARRARLLPLARAWDAVRPAVRGVAGLGRVPAR